MCTCCKMSLEYAYNNNFQCYSYVTVYQSVRGVPGAGIEPARLFRARDFKSQNQEV